MTNFFPCNCRGQFCTWGTFRLTIYEFRLFVFFKNTCWESRRSDISSVIRDKKINELLLTVLIIFVIGQWFRDFLILRIVSLVLFLTKKKQLLRWFLAFHVQNRRAFCSCKCKSVFLWCSVVAQALILLLILSVLGVVLIRLDLRLLYLWFFSPKGNSMS